MVKFYLLVPLYIGTPRCHNIYLERETKSSLRHNHKSSTFAMVAIYLQLLLQQVSILLRNLSAGHTDICIYFIQLLRKNY